MIKIWENFYVKSGKKNLFFPSETLVRCFKGDYIKNFEFKKIGNYNCKILDVGFGSGNNLVFLNSLGFKLFGTEVSNKICSTTKKRLLKLKINCNLKKGTNTKIPFKNSFFDCLISWDVIHYEKNIQSYKSAIKEYLRVLKPNGRLILSTAAPQSSLFKKSLRINRNVVVCKNKKDIRYNKKFICFKNINAFKKLYINKFYDCNFGRHTSIIFSENYDSFLFTGKKYL